MACRISFYYFWYALSYLHHRNRGRESRFYIFNAWKCVLTSDVFFIRWTQARTLIWKEKCFLNHCPGRDSYHLFIKHHHISLSVILFTYIWALSSKTLQWNLGYRIDKFDLGWQKTAVCKTSKLRGCNKKQRKVYGFHFRFSI